jgi:hypothetical protein
MSHHVHVNALILALAVSSRALSAQAEAPAPDPPAITILDETSECGGAPTLELGPTGGFSLTFPGLVVAPDATSERVRKLCLVRLQITAPEAFCVERGEFAISGAATIAPGTRGSNLSARYFALGDPGADHFERLLPETGSGEIHAVSTGSTPWLFCAKEALLSVIVDVTLGRGAPQTEEKSSITITKIEVPKLLLSACPSASHGGRKEP